MAAKTYAPKRAQVLGKVAADGWQTLIAVNATKTRIVNTILAVAKTNNDTPVLFYAGTAAPVDDLDAVKVTAPAKDGTSGSNAYPWSGAPVHLDTNDGLFVKNTAANAASFYAFYVEEQ